MWVVLINILTNRNAPNTLTEVSLMSYISKSLVLNATFKENVRGLLVSSFHDRT